MVVGTGGCAGRSCRVVNAAGLLERVSRVSLFYMILIISLENTIWMSLSQDLWKQRERLTVSCLNSVS